MREAIACAPCSDVPHPGHGHRSRGGQRGGDRLGDPRSRRGGAAEHALVSAGCAAIISCMTHGGPGRSSG
jgi:hypothetical protein